MKKETVKHIEGDSDFVLYYLDMTTIGRTFALSLPHFSACINPHERSVYSPYLRIIRTGCRQFYSSCFLCVKPNTN